MSKVVVFTHLTLDGVMQAPGRPGEGPMTPTAASRTKAFGAHRPSPWVRRLQKGNQMAFAQRRTAAAPAPSPGSEDEARTGGGPALARRRAAA